MIARLILALLLAAFALPAMASAPCHDAATGAMPAHHSTPVPGHDRPERDQKAIAVHSCMGCIPPASLIRPTVAAPVVPQGTMLVAALVRFDAERAMPPATPPPRFAA